MGGAEFEQQVAHFEHQIRDQLTHVDWFSQGRRSQVYDAFKVSVDEQCVSLRKSGQSAAANSLEGALQSAVGRIENLIMQTLAQGEAQPVRATAGSSRQRSEMLVSIPRNKEVPSMPAESAAVREQKARQAGKTSTRSILLPILYGLALVALAGLQLLQMLSPGALGFMRGSLDDCSTASQSCFDTGWQPVSNKSSSIYFYRHNLGSQPRTITAWFSPTADGRQSYLIAKSFPNPNAGNPITIETRDDLILVHTWNGAAIHGVYNGSTQQWTAYAEGFYRFVARK